MKRRKRVTIDTKCATCAHYNKISDICYVDKSKREKLGCLGTRMKLSDGMVAMKKDGTIVTGLYSRNNQPQQQ